MIRTRSAVHRAGVRRLRCAPAILILCCSAVPLFAQKPPLSPATLAGEAIEPADLGPSVIEPMSAVLERQRAQETLGTIADAGAGPQLGAWLVPPPRAAKHAASGQRYIVNGHGAARMAIGFPEPVDVHGMNLAGQGAPQLWARCVRVIGYRAGARATTSEWVADLGGVPEWIALDFRNVDRIEFEAQPVLGNAAWYAIDDLTFAPVREPGAVVVLDFEDTRYKQDLTQSGYAGLEWEVGELGFAGVDEVVPAPRGLALPQSETSGGDTGEPALRGTGTNPELVAGFEGVVRGDAGSFSAPPDTCGAIGPDHYVITVNRNFAVYDRNTGLELLNTTLGAFLPGSNGDPRVLFDQHSNRWVIAVSDFNTRIFLAVSGSDDPTGTWFKTSFVAATGSDAGCFPDYETLGVDANGIYTAAYMAGCGMSLFVLDKAPLVAPVQSLGTVTAFRGFPFEGAIQPVHTYGSPAGEYCISVDSSTGLRLRRVNPPMNAPTVTDLGTFTVPFFSDPPLASALGSFIQLDTVDSRIMNAVYRGGSIYAAHCIDSGGRAACRWYQLNPTGLVVVQSGTISDPVRSYMFPSIAANSRGDVAVGFSGSSPSERASAYFAGRLAGDPLGQLGNPVPLKAGSAPQNIIDSVGRNRFGDYSLTTLDPLGEIDFWTVQEFVKTADAWAVWVGWLSHDPVPLRIELVGDTPPLVAPATPTTFDVRITPLAESVIAGSPKLFARINGGSFFATPLAALGGDLYRATLPTLACGSTVEFYLRASGSGGSEVFEPFGASTVVYAAEVGIETVVFADNFQTNLGWTVQNSNLTDGPWERGVPVGQGDRSDPATDWDGSGACYLTDNVDGNSDIDGGPTQLTSPIFDCSAAGEHRVSYARWFVNNDSVDHFTVEISNNGGASWTQVESVLGAAGWRIISIDVADFVAPTSQMRMRFSATDNPNDSVAEAALDAFVVTRRNCTGGGRFEIRPQQRGP